MRRPVNVLAAAVGLSALGDFLALVPLALHLEEETGSGFVLAALFGALWAPSILLAGVGGTLADRFDPRRVLVASSLAQAAVAVALAFADAPAAVLVLALLLGAGNAVSQPAEFALLPRVTDDIPSANGRMEAARYAGFTIGPLAGGLAAAGGGTTVALLVDAATFTAIALAATWLRTAAAPREQRPVEGRARHGLAHLRSDAVLRSVLPVAVAALVVMTAVWTAEVFFAKDVLEVGDAGYGALTAVWMTGVVAGSLLLAPRVGPRRTAGVALLAVAVQGAGIAVPGALPLVAVTVVAFAVGGLAHGVKNVLLRTLIHQRTPEHLHGRAFAAYNALRNGAELSALALGGTLVAVAGPRATMAIAGSVPGLLVAVVVVRRRLLTRRPAAGAPARAAAPARPGSPLAPSAPPRAAPAVAAASAAAAQP
jgi:MFS family permease